MIAEGWSLVAAATSSAEPSAGVFVPAIMGAGLLFSLLTILRDVFSLSSKTAQAKRARVRGNLVAGRLTDGVDGVLPHAHLAGRPVLALTGLVVLAASVYLAINATVNFIHDEGYLRDLAWVWGASLVVVGGGLYVAFAFLGAARRAGSVPPWTWPVLLSTPLAGTGATERGRRMRTTVVAGLAVVTGLSALATFHHLIDGFDERTEELLDVDWLAQSEVARIPGSTNASIAAAVVIGIATLRCRRFAWAFVATFLVGLAMSNALRFVVDRPRPDDGDRSGAVESFPSGHLVQATLLAVLLPLALYELTRSRMARRVASWMLAFVVLFVAVVAVSSDRHHPTDVIAGIALGLAIATWASLSLLPPEGHDDCRDCVFGRRSPDREVSR